METFFNINCGAKNVKAGLSAGLCMPWKMESAFDGVNVIDQGCSEACAGQGASEDRCEVRARSTAESRGKSRAADVPLADRRSSKGRQWRYWWQCSPRF